MSVDLKSTAHPAYKIRLLYKLCIDQLAYIAVNLKK